MTSTSSEDLGLFGLLPLELVQMIVSQTEYSGLIGLMAAIDTSSSRGSSGAGTSYVSLAIRHALTKRYNKHKFTCRWAIEKQRLDVFEYIFRKRKPHKRSYKDILDTAVVCGNVAVIEYMTHATDVELQDYHIDLALMNGQDDVFDYMRDRQFLDTMMTRNSRRKQERDGHFLRLKRRLMYDYWLEYDRSEMMLPLKLKVRQRHRKNKVYDELMLQDDVYDIVLV